jgi:hypothetical protein
MRIAISLPKGYDQYENMCVAINAQQFDELVAIKNHLLERYKQEFNKPIQFFDIDWNNIVGSKNVKSNRFGKMYNADAPETAAKKVVDYATHIMEFAEGDYNINKLAKAKGLPFLQVEKDKINKRYKF